MNENDIYFTNGVEHIPEGVDYVSYVGFPAKYHALNRLVVLLRALNDAGRVVFANCPSGEPCDRTSAAIEQCAIDSVAQPSVARELARFFSDTDGEWKYAAYGRQGYTVEDLRAEAERNDGFLHLPAELWKRRRYA